MYVRQGSIVTALQSKPLSITATCFQYHEYGRRTGLKIRSSQEGVGSSPTFGTEDLRHVATRVAITLATFRQQGCDGIGMI